MTDADFDARFAALRDIEPPLALQASTLTAYAVLRRPQPRKAPRWPWAAGGFALAAAALLAVFAQPPERGDPAAFVPRGSGEITPVITLRVAVRTSSATGAGDQLSRLSTDTRYRVGDTLLFRVTIPSPMNLTLSRNGVPLWTGPVRGGDVDLPVGYTLEAGDDAAVFRVEGNGVSAEIGTREVAP